MNNARFEGGNTFIFSAGQRFYGHNICVFMDIIYVCTVYIYVYIKTHIKYIFRKYSHVCIYIIYKCFIYKHPIFLKYMHACVYLCMRKKYTQYTHMYYVHKN